MTDPASSRTAERLTTGLVAGFFAAYGWYALVQDGIILKGRSGRISLATGSVKLALAWGAFGFAALLLLLLLRTFDLPARRYWGPLALLLLPPLLYLLLKR